MSNDIDWHSLDVATQGVRAEPLRSPEGEHSPSIYATSSFVSKSAADAAAVFAEEKPGNLYSRFTNPTIQALERRLAVMEGGEACVATSSGMSAILATCLGLLEAGDHIVASQTLFGSSISLFNNYMGKFAVEVTYVSPTDVDAWQPAIQPNTKLLFLETPSNPLTEIADVQALADVAHENNCLLVVDNCFCTPILQRPLALGADLIVHSATKYLDGQGRCLGGAVVGNRELVQKVLGVVRTCGPCISPFNAWVILKGLETLGVRMRGHCENAMAVAQWLEQQPQVAQVYYPGLSSHPQHALAQQQQDGFGGVVAFDVQGGREAAWKVIDSTSLLSITANLGDTRTTITHPATTTHGRIPAEARELAGIGEGLVRLAVGLEAVQDIINDLERALA